eukprot:899637-Rhodomonas_salina.2
MISGAFPLEPAGPGPGRTLPALLHNLCLCLEKKHTDNLRLPAGIERRRPSPILWLAVTLQAKLQHSDGTRAFRNHHHRARGRGKREGAVRGSTDRVDPRPPAATAYDVVEYHSTSLQAAQLGDLQAVRRPGLGTVVCSIQSPSLVRFLAVAPARRVLLLCAHPPRCPCWDVNAVPLSRITSPGSPRSQPSL